MARLSEGTGTVVLEGIDTPVADTDAANKAYVDDNVSETITASGGLERVENDISIATDGVTNAKIANGAVAGDNIAANAVTESKMNASNVPTAGQVLSSTSGTEGFTWVDQTGGDIPNYNDAPFGSIDDGSRLWTYTTADNPATEGQIAIDDQGDQGYTLQFRTQDIDVVNSVSVRYFQIGYGSPISFATYVVADLSITDTLVDVNVMDGPIDGDDILASLPANGTSLSISVSVNQFRLNLADINDVSSTAATNNQVLTWDSTNNQWEPAASQGGGGGASSLNDLDDVSASNPVDGYILRAVGDGSDTTWTEHSLGDTNRLYGGLDIDMPSSFTVPQGTGDSAIAVGDDAQATQDDAVAIGTNTDSTGLSSIAIGNASTASDNSATAVGRSTTASGASSSAFGDAATTSHAESSAIGFGAETEQVNEVRLGIADSHVTIEPTAAGTEGSDNALASVRYVKDRIADANRIVDDNINGIQTITRAAQPTPWGDYMIDPYQSDDTTFQIAMSVIEFDASQPTYIFYPPMLQNIVNNMNGGGLSTGTIPSFFEEITDVQTPNNIGGIDGNDENALGWKYTGFHNATVWMNSPVEILTQWRWVNHDASNASIFPPNVTVKFQLVHVKPEGGVYNIDDDNAVVIAETNNFTFYQPTQVPAGDTRAHDVNMTFPSQTQSQGVVNVATNDMIALRYRISFKGNGFEWDNDTTTGLSLDAYIQKTEEFTPMFGIEHVTIGDSLVIESLTGDLVYTDHVSSNTLLVVDNNEGVPIIPSASLGLVAGDGIGISDKTVSIDFRTETNNPLEASGSGSDAGLSLNIDEDGPLSKTTNGLDVTIETNGGLSIGSLSSGIEVNLQTGSGLQTNANGLSLNAGLDDLTNVSVNESLLSDLDLLAWNVNGLDGNAWRSVTFNLGVLPDVTINNTVSDGEVLTYDSADDRWENRTLPAASTTLSALTDVTIGTPADGQILEYDSATSMWVNTTLSGNHSFTAGTNLDFNSDSTVLNWTANLSDLGDVSTVAPALLDVLSWNGTNWSGVAPPAAGEPYVDINFTAGDSTPDVGAFARAIGIGADASVGGINGVAVGFGASADGASSAAYGTDSTSSGVNSISIGHDSTATATSTTSLGDSADATSIGAVAVGSSSSASGTRSISIGSAASSSGENAISIGRSAGTGGARSIGIGDDPSTGDNALAIAIGERALVEATRGIAIGSSSNSALENADRVTASGINSIAIGRAAQATAEGATAIGDGATNSNANSTVLGAGPSHRVFAGTREITPLDFSVSSIAFNTNTEYFVNGYNPSSTVNETLKYTQIGNLVSGTLKFNLSGTTSTVFAEGDRWLMTSTSQNVLDCFGYAPGTQRVPVGIFSVEDGSAARGVFGDWFVHSNTSDTSVTLGFRVRTIWGATIPGCNEDIVANFSLSKI